MPPIATLVALADPTRCRIIEILHQGPQPVHVLASAFDISRPAISRHLRVLKQAKVISETKTGRENRYALHAARLKPVQDWLDTLKAAAKPQRRPAAAKTASAAPKTRAQPPSSPVAPSPAKGNTGQMGFDF